jgi:hypothetical protein
MGKLSIFRRTRDMEDPLHGAAISALFWIVLTAVIGVVVITLVGELVIAGVFGEFNDAATGRTDEAISVLAQIGSGAVGAMAGWLARDRLFDANSTGYQQLPPEPTPQEVAMPAPVPADTPEGPLPDDGDPAYDPDLVFDDEPEDLTDDETPDDVSDEGVEGE